MTTEDYIAHSLALLSALDAFVPWSDTQEKLWIAALWTAPPEVGGPIVDEIAFTGKRPSPAEFLAKVVERMCPTPSVGEAWEEVMEAVERPGLYGKPHPEHPNILLEGAPPFSHPVITTTVAHLGEWRRFCSGEAGLGSTLYAQFRDTYKTVVGRFQAEALEELKRPEGDRDNRYFAIAPRRKRVIDRLEAPPPMKRLALPPAPEQEDWQSMPEGVRQLVSKLANRRSIPADKGDRPGLSTGDRERAEEEIRTHRERGTPTP